jgi:hypothetical protein
LNAITYTLMSYGLTVVISLLVVGLIVLINKIVSGKEQEGENND